MNTGQLKNAILKVYAIMEILRVGAKDCNGMIDDRGTYFVSELK